MQVFTKHPIVCGLEARSVQLDQYQERLDITTGWDTYYKYIPTGPLLTTAEFEFLLTRQMLLDHAAPEFIFNLFPVGEGNFTGRDLGPSDVCQYCGTAWLPGTLKCYNCGGETDHFNKAIEYHCNTGMITRKTIEEKIDGYVTLRVTVEFTNLALTNTPFQMFERSLWRNAPALWVCRFCGYVVLGETVDCPGCGGKRVPIKELATQKRYCIYCNRVTYGNYACEYCNQRLMAVKE